MMDTLRRYLEGTVIANAWSLWFLLKCNLLTVATRRLNLLEASQSNRGDLCRLLVDDGQFDLRGEVDRIALTGEVDKNTGLTPLLIACMAGSSESLSVLLENRDQPPPPPYPPHTQPQARTANEKIQAATKKSLAACDAKMRSPLYHACKGGHTDCVKVIFSSLERLGEDTTADLLQLVDTVGHTPLHAACLAISADTVEMLVASGANVNSIGRDGCTPIMLLTRTRPSMTTSLSEKHLDFSVKEVQRGKIVTTLLAQGAQIDLRDCFGAGLVHLACGGCGCQISNSILEQVRHHDLALLQGHLKDIDNDGMNALHILCQKAGTIYMDDKTTEADVEADAHFVACQFLLEHGIDPNDKCYGTTTALMQLAWGTPNAVSVQMARILLASQRCDVCFEHEGWSVLHVARKQGGTSEMFKVLELFMSEHHADYMANFDAHAPRVQNVECLQQRRVGVNNQFSQEQRRGLLQGRHTVEGISQHVLEMMRIKKACKVVVLTGAGISVSCGIPDFRSPGTGVYANEKYKNAFNRETLLNNPKEVWGVVKNMMGGVLSGSTKPSLAHCFIKMLHDKGMLLRNFTQNIDMLEAKVGIPSDKVVEAHGSIARAVCMSCGHTTTVEAIQDQILDDACPAPQCAFACKGVYRPDVVLFGEPLSGNFLEVSVRDIKTADVLIVMGTSLKVYPFAGLVNQVGPLAPRLLINKTHSGPFERLQSFPHLSKTEESLPAGAQISLQQSESPDRPRCTSLVQKIVGVPSATAVEGGESQLPLDPPNNSPALSQRTGTNEMGVKELGIEDTSSYRDAVFIGDCDDGVRELARHLGWEQELLDMHFNL